MRKISIVSMILVALLSTACEELPNIDIFIDFDYEEDDDVCEYGDMVYELGESFPAEDGCNTCYCEADGIITCTLIGCVASCYYNGDVYLAGESFPAGDGCNTCSCDESGKVYCTKMVCPGNECTEGMQYFEPGCGPASGMPEIEPGCYAPCQSRPCDDGICQLTDINPCICDEAMPCCDACGRHEWLCLDPPQTCPEISSSPMVLSAGKSFGACLGECDFDINIETDTQDGDCLSVVLTVCGWADTGCTRENKGTLTPLGQAKATGLAAELIGVKLQEIYGCPDCADGGASQLTLRLDGGDISLSYEWNKPPELLVKVDTFTQGVIDALDTCTPNDDVVMDLSTCIPRAN